MSQTNDIPARQHLLDVESADLSAMFDEWKIEPFRAKQVLEWIYLHGATSFEAMTNLSKLLRTRLAESFNLFSGSIVRRLVSTDGTVKLLVAWPDGATSECVMIPSETRRTACISSQVGCPAQCKFCASGVGGLERNLTTGEILEQALLISAEAQATGQRLSNIVFMGSGEPLTNYDNVMRAVRTLNAPWSLGIGARKITISTVGLPRQIRRLADEGLQLNLALSLHAPTDALRQELIPWAEKISLAELVGACAHFFKQTGREITLEYILLRGVNDLPVHAQALAKFARQFRCNVNLLRYNPVEGLGFDRPSSAATHSFVEYLRSAGVNAHVRTSRGLDIDAACGQLRRREMQAGASDISLNVIAT
jgi:23S rRNA (adenine2503-C2)-methyltransferase